MLGKHLDSSIHEIQVDAIQDSAPVAQKAKRRWNRMASSAKVVLRSGNSSQRQATFVEGRCRDTSNTGFAATFESPAAVGDIYYAEISLDERRPFGVLARCVRCQMQSEDSFECGFSFFQAVSLVEPANSSNQPVTNSSSLI